jgi:hypothetical protein
MMEGAATRMKKFHHTEQPPVQFDVTAHQHNQTPSPNAMNVMTQDVKFSQEEIWMVEWETRNLKRSAE